MLAQWLTVIALVVPPPEWPESPSRTAQQPRAPSLSSGIPDIRGYHYPSDSARTTCPPHPRSGLVRIESAYFPTGALDDTRCRVNAAVLSKAGEEPLTASETSHTLRFVWGRTFHDAYVIRADMPTNADGAITSIRLPRKSGAPDERVAPLDSASKAELEELVSELAVCGIRQEGQIGFDGARWMIESMSVQGHCLVEGWSPNPGTPLGDLGRTLIELSGREIPEQDIY